MRLIDADALMKEFAEYVRDSNNSDFERCPTWNDAVSLLGSAPTVVPELPKHFMSDDCISRAELYRAVCDIEELARQRVIDTPSRLPNGDQNPYAIRYATQLDERSKFKFMVADARSVEPEHKTGRWEITDAYPHNVYCSECHKKFAQTHWTVWEDGSLPRNYCPNCGARMVRGEEHENKGD